MAQTYSRSREPCINLLFDATLPFGGATGTDVSEVEQQEGADLPRRRRFGLLSALLKCRSVRELNRGASESRMDI